MLSIQKGGGVIGVELLGESLHKTNVIVGESVLVIEGVVDHFLHDRLVKFRYFDLAKVGALHNVFLASFLHRYYEWLEWCCFALNVAYD